MVPPGQIENRKLSPGEEGTNCFLEMELAVKLKELSELSFMSNCKERNGVICTPVGARAGAVINLPSQICID
jgi:hypothetical protein